VYFDSLRMPPVTMIVEEREEQKNTEAVDTMACSWWIPRSVVSSFPVRQSTFSWLFNFQAVFNVFYTRGYSASHKFAIKGGSHPYFNTHPHPIYSILLHIPLVRISLQEERRIKLKWRFARILSQVCTMVQLRSDVSISFLFSSPLFSKIRFMFCSFDSDFILILNLCKY